MKTTFLLLRIQTSKRIIAIFLLFAVLSMWAAADAYAQNKIKYTYDSAGNRLTRQKEMDEFDIICALFLSHFHVFTNRFCKIHK